MPKLLYTLLSELINIDLISNNISVFNILEEIQVEKFPVRFPRLFITSVWLRTESEKNFEFETKTSFLNPTTQKKGEWLSSFKMTKLRHRSIISSTKILFDVPGKYTFKVYIRKKGETKWGKVVLSMPFEALKVSRIKSN